MKKTFLLLSFFVLILRESTTAQNPYASLGKVAPVLTLSNGKYQEFMTNDTIVQIGSVLFNTITNEVVSFLDEDSLRLMEADMMTRFLSVDPIGRQYPELTPYQFASNTPIQAIDLDGLEKLIVTGTVPNTELAPNGTHYYQNQILIFREQGDRLDRKYQGVTVQSVSTGKDVLNAMINETKTHGQISFFAYFGHAGFKGFFLRSDKGFYATNVKDEYTSSVGELKEKIATKEIVFAKNTTCFLGGCSAADGATAGMANETTIVESLLNLDLTVIASDYKVEMKNPKKTDGRFITQGNFWRFTLVTTVTEKEIPNPDKSSWQFWKPDTIKVKEEKKEIKAEKLGNEIKVDDYIGH